MSRTADERALVLGGGGVAGIAWETGLVVGLAEAGIDLGLADVVVGTSAGSVVGGLVRGGTTAAAYAAVLASAEGSPTDEALPAPDIDRFLQAMADALAGPVASAAEARARIGAPALLLPADHQTERVAVFERLLGRTEWPEGELRITAVDAEDGTFTTFDRDSGVELATAVAASCAVPVVYPVVEIAGRKYMDGGMRSATNADLVSGAGRVLVLACNPEPGSSPLGPQLPEAVEQLRSTGRVVVVEPDEASRRAFGANPLSQAARIPCARAGHAQAAAEAERIAALWG